MLYFPNVPPEAAVKRLGRWINNCPALVLKLKAFPTRKTSKYWIRQQVELISEYLCDP